MTTEELNTIIAQAEGGDIAAMNQLTRIYSESDGYINLEQAAKWFLALIQKDCDPNSGVYEKTGYNKDLYEKIKNTILHSVSVNEMASLSGSFSSSSLFGGAIFLPSSNAKLYINQAEEAIVRNKAYKEAEAKKKAEARRKADEEVQEVIRQLQQTRVEGYDSAYDEVSRLIAVGWEGVAAMKVYGYTKCEFGTAHMVVESIKTREIILKLQQTHVQGFDSAYDEVSHLISEGNTLRAVMKVYDITNCKMETARTIVESIREIK